MNGAIMKEMVEGQIILHPLQQRKDAMYICPPTAAWRLPHQGPGAAGSSLALANISDPYDQRRIDRATGANKFAGQWCVFPLPPTAAGNASGLELEECLAKRDFIPAGDIPRQHYTPIAVHDCRCTRQAYHPPIAGDIPRQWHPPTVLPRQCCPPIAGDISRQHHPPSARKQGGITKTSPHKKPSACAYKFMSLVGPKLKASMSCKCLQSKKKHRALCAARH
eukprot:1045937-Pelagomonas_calceolata.AAC.5